MKKIFLLLLFLSAQALHAHKFYASITDATYNNESGSLEVILKFFVDDFEEAIHFHFKENLELGTAAEKENSDELIERYVNRGFEISNENITYSNSYVGHESDKDYIWIYIELKDFKREGKLNLKNSLLTEVFPEQSNQVNFDLETGIETYSLHKNKVSISF